MKLIKAKDVKVTDELVNLGIVATATTLGSYVRITFIQSLSISAQFYWYPSDTLLYLAEKK